MAPETLGNKENPNRDIYGSPWEEEIDNITLSKLGALMGGEGGRARGREQGGREEKMHFLKFILGKIHCEYRKTYI